ncbi:3-dehydroquinate synthase [bacterium]|nr:3-dehydroquinate synthase [bacterium]
MHKATILHQLAELPQFLKNLEFSSLFVLCDQNTQEYCLPLLAPHLPKHQVIAIRNGEQYKTINDCEKIWQRLIDKSADRKSLVINLGGGMITDMGGFAAATFKRGLAIIHIPTTLLGMVDAAIGGKTGVNFKGIKNQIGTFTEPYAVVADQIFLKTLPKSEMRSGLGEVIKYGFIHSPHILAQLESEPQNHATRIAQCIAIKLQIVKDDPFEAGLRQILNFGHTLGHAYEAYSHSNGPAISHGEAVAWGMLSEMYLSQEKTGFSEEEMAEASALIFKHFGKPVFLRGMPSVKEVSQYLSHDKKNVGNQIICTLLKAIGQPVTGISITVEEAENAIKWLKTQY